MLLLLLIGTSGHVAAVTTSASRMLSSYWFQGLMLNIVVILWIAGFYIQRLLTILDCLVKLHLLVCSEDFACCLVQLKRVTEVSTAQMIFMFTMGFHVGNPRL